MRFFNIIRKNILVLILTLKNFIREQSFYWETIFILYFKCNIFNILKIKKLSSSIDKIYYFSFFFFFVTLVYISIYFVLRSNYLLILFILLPDMK